MDLVFAGVAGILGMDIIYHEHCHDLIAGSGVLERDRQNLPSTQDSISPDPSPL